MVPPTELDSVKRKVSQKARELKHDIRAEIQEHKKHVTKMVVLGVIAIGALVVVAGKFFA